MQTPLNDSPVIDPASHVDALLAQGCQGVTIDVFDTLLWRQTLYPSDAFYLLAEAHGAHHHQLRIFVEKVVSHLCRRILRREPTLGDIYRFYPLPADEELTIEARICQPNPFCLQLIKNLLSRGIAVAAISDMYLDNEQIAQLLRRSGYPEFPVYSSASVHLTKYRDGRLFHYVWQQMGLLPSNVVHVGDNPKADIHMASKLGAHVCQVAVPRDSLAQYLMHPLPSVESASESLAWGCLAIDLHRSLGLGIIQPPLLTVPWSDIQPPADQSTVLRNMNIWLQSQKGLAQ